jgi:hypothetical protein
MPLRKVLLFRIWQKRHYSEASARMFQMQVAVVGSVNVSKALYAGASR